MIAKHSTETSNKVELRINRVRINRTQPLESAYISGWSKLRNNHVDKRGWTNIRTHLELLDITYVPVNRVHDLVHEVLCR